MSKPYLLVIALLGCRGTAAAKDAPGPDCQRAGDSCEYAPGKLGLCVDGNISGSGSPKLICQSQH